MSVLDRDALAASPLADLHLIAAELGLDGFRRLRKDDLVDAIVARQGGGAENGDETAATSEDEQESAPARRRRSRRRRRDADGDSDADGAGDAETETEAEAEAEEEPEPAPARQRSRSRSSDRGSDRGSERSSGRGRGREAEREPEAEPEEESVVEGVVELLPNGSGFVRLTSPEPSDDDVYVSAAQVRRCELVSGDRVSGPVRSPRRSERFPSLVRVDTINGRPADEVAAGTPFDELPAAFPSERLPLGLDDATVKAIEWLTPFGRGSRVTICGAVRSGKTFALRQIAGVLAATDGLDIQLVLAGVRPEEVGEWREGPVEPLVAVTLAASSDAQAAAVDHAIEHGKRVAARGGHAVVLIDTLAYVPPATARRALAAARNIVDGGSLTVIATATEPLGGETTVIAFDHELTSTGRFPALDLLNSGSLHAELLVGEAGARAITDARAEALG